jgi:hypothetical protein
MSRARGPRDFIYFTFFNRIAFEETMENYIGSAVRNTKIYCQTEERNGV